MRRTVDLVVTPISASAQPQSRATTHDVAGDFDAKEEMRGDRSPRGRFLPWRRAELVLAIYLALAAIWVLRAWSHGGGSAGPVGSLGDPLLFVWYMAWVPFSIGHAHNPVFTHYLMAPQGASLLINSSILLPAFVLSPITLIWGPVVSYNLLMTLAPALSGFAAYWVCRRITGTDAGAFVCGLIYGFGPFMQAQTLAHAHVAIAIYPPFVLAIIYELAVVQHRSAVRVGALLGLGSVLQLLTGEEILVLTLGMAGLLLLVMAAVFREEVRARAKHILRGLGAAAVVGTVLGGPLIAFEIFGPRHVDGLLQARDTYVTDVAGVVVPSRFQWLGTAGMHHLTNSFSGFDGEFGAYLGIPLILLFAFAARRLWKNPVVRCATFVAVISLVLSLGSRIHLLGHKLPIPLPMIVLSHIPVLENLIPDRLAIFTALAVGFVVALFIRELPRYGLRKRQMGITAALVALITIAPSVPAPAASLNLPGVFAQGSHSPIPKNTIAFIYPVQSSGFLAMAAQVKAEFRFRLAQGGVFTPDGFGSPKSHLVEVVADLEQGTGLQGPSAACRGASDGQINEVCRSILAADLRRFDIGAVVVLPARGYQQAITMFSAYYHRPPLEDGGVWLWVQPPDGPSSYG